MTRLLQPPRHDYPFFDRIAKPLVKADYLSVGLANHQHRLGHPPLGQPLFRMRHDLAPGSLVLMPGVDCDIVDPSTMAIVADHGGCHDLRLGPSDTYHQYRIFRAQAELDVRSWIVPRTRKIARLPQCNNVF